MVTSIKDRVRDFTDTFEKSGFLVIPGVVAKDSIAQLCDALRSEFARANGAGELFVGGGMISGHLNCFPGECSRFVYDRMADSGIWELVRKLSPQSAREPNIGCNINLPGSSAQNRHIDGYASTPFMIANVAVVDTVESNGAIEIYPESHRRDYKYWEFAVAAHRPLRVAMKAGDVLLRSSALWHRGMPNRSGEIRPMLGFSWEEGGSKLADPYSVHEGRIRFLPNRYTNGLSGRLRERAFARFPTLGSGYLFVRSMFG